MCRTGIIFFSVYGTFYFFMLFYMFRRNNIHACPGHIFQDYVANLYRSFFLDSFECFDAVKNLPFWNIFLCLYRYHIFSSAFYPDRGSHNPGRICHFLSRVDIASFACISCNTYDLSIFHLYRNRTAHRTADTG